MEPKNLDYFARVIFQMATYSLEKLARESHQLYLTMRSRNTDIAVKRNASCIQAASQRAFHPENRQTPRRMDFQGDNVHMDFTLSPPPKENTQKTA